MEHCNTCKQQTLSVLFTSTVCENPFCSDYKPPLASRTPRMMTKDVTVKLDGRTVPLYDPGDELPLLDTRVRPEHANFKCVMPRFDTSLEERIRKELRNMYCPTELGSFGFRF